MNREGPLATAATNNDAAPQSTKDASANTSDLGRLVALPALSLPQVKLQA